MRERRSAARTTALRRFRELVCFTCAALLWIVAWRIERDGFEGHRGILAALTLAALEMLTLFYLFYREQNARTEIRLRTPWITVAWASLPLWWALDVLVGSVLSNQ
jgi:hypothetical protein